MFSSKDTFIPGDDETIILRYQKGDLSGIDLLIRKYESPVYGICFKQCVKIKGYAGAKYQAEDLAQEVWKKVFLNVSSYQPVSSFKAWLMTITKNTIRDWLKKAYIREEVSEVELHKEDMGNDNGFSGFEDHQSSLNQQIDPENMAMKNNLLHILKVCKQKLEPDSQKMMDMYLEEKTQRDMAVAFGLSLGAVNKRVKAISLNLAQCFIKHGWTVEDMAECFQS